MAKTVSFYSYKGGVGRSLLLANVAVLLAQRGKRVACIDFDLEAGGLHTIFGIEPDEIRYTLLDLLCAPGMPDAERGLIQLTPRLPNVKAGGELWLLPTISEASKLNQALTQRKEAELLSSLNILISQIAGARNPHFILIDSRSGLAELASAATDRLTASSVYFGPIAKMPRD